MKVLNNAEDVQSDIAIIKEICQHLSLFQKGYLQIKILIFSSFMKVICVDLKDNKNVATYTEIHSPNINLGLTFLYPFCINGIKKEFYFIKLYRIKNQTCRFGISFLESTHQYLKTWKMLLLIYVFSYINKVQTIFKTNQFKRENVFDDKLIINLKY